MLLPGQVAANHQCRRTSIWLCVLHIEVVPIVFDRDASAVRTMLRRDAHVMLIEEGQFNRLADGGTKAGREYLSAIAPPY